jgi:hypothetical protein
MTQRQSTLTGGQLTRTIRPIDEQTARAADTTLMLACQGTMTQTIGQEEQISFRGQKP